MAKLGKLRKLKSAIKRWPSMSKQSGGSSSGNEEYMSCNNNMQYYQVFVGRSRREYQVSSDVVEHPVFQEVLDKSWEEEGLFVSCEVVLFEHMLWMLQNAPATQLGSAHDLAQFYT